MNKSTHFPTLPFLGLFLFLFILRTAFGLSTEFMENDRLQTYLIGLKWYGAGGWPFFGPDLIFQSTFRAQIPGALEAFLVGGPFYLLPIPEAPYLLLNLLSLSAIALLSWYLSRRIQGIPFLFIFAWISILPWTLNQSTWVLNPSYLLFGSVLFWIGALETIPALSTRFLPLPQAVACMGFGIFWDMQFHFSWILLAPYIPIACFFYCKREGWGDRIWKFSFYLLVGAALPVSLILPTVIRFGWHILFTGESTFVFINIKNALAFFTILARYLSLACFEIPQFVGHHTKDRWEFLTVLDPWLFPFAMFLLVVGWIQPFVMLVNGFIQPLISYLKKRLPATSQPGEGPLFLLAGSAFLFYYISFWFTQKEPFAHISYVYFPLVTVFSFYIWSKFAKKSFWKKFGIFCLVANLLLQSGLAIYWLPRRSLYLNRDQVVKAIQEKNYRILGERRPGSIY
jgi:hypothetical protein